MTKSPMWHCYHGNKLKGKMYFFNCCSSSCSRRKIFFINEVNLENLFTPRYSWNSANFGINYQSINQSIFHPCLFVYTYSYLSQNHRPTPIKTYRSLENTSSEHVITLAFWVNHQSYWCMKTWEQNVYRMLLMWWLMVSLKIMVKHCWQVINKIIRLSSWKYQHFFLNCFENYFYYFKFYNIF